MFAPPLSIGARLQVPPTHLRQHMQQATGRGRQKLPQTVPGSRGGEVPQSKAHTHHQVLREEEEEGGHLSEQYCTHKQRLLMASNTNNKQHSITHIRTYTLNIYVLPSLWQHWLKLHTHVDTDIVPSFEDLTLHM